MSVRDIIQAAAGVGGTAETDPNFKQTVLLLHGDGTNGAQNNTFLDSSSNNFTITRNPATGPNAPTQGTFSPFSLAAGQWSNFFDGSGDYLTIADNAALNLGSNNFTIEYRIYMSTIGGGGIIAKNRGASVFGEWSCGINSSGFPDFACTTGGEQNSWNMISNFTSSIAISANAWNHVAIVRNGNNFTIYVNGVSGATTTNSNTITDGAAAISIYSNKDNGQFGPSVPAYLSNIRITIGTALYTSAFTPSTVPLTTTSQGASSSEVELLTCQSNRFVDNSTNAFAITRNGDVRVTPFSPFAPTAAYSAGTNGGSGYFDGTGDYLSVAANTALDVGSGNFSIDVWAYPNSKTNTVDSVFGYGAFTMMLYHDNTNWTLEMSNNGSSNQVAASFSVILNSWQYISIRKSGTSVTVYRNGTSVATGTISGSVNTASKTLEVGRNGVSPQSFTGWISNFRLVKGTSVADVTPPTAPLTAITNTSLLLNFTNAGIFDQTGKNVLETVGNAQIDTAVKKFGTGSLEFDGNDCIAGPSVPDMAFLTGDYTIEAWVYPTSIRNGENLVFCVDVTGGVSFGYNQTQLYIGARGIAYDLQVTYTMPTNSWTHLAAARQNGTVRIFANGTLVGSGTVTRSSPQGRPSVGDYVNLLGNGVIGFIDDLRITKGVARYTANFTPPTKTFADQ